ncbi:hypothetical protein BS47DRAFT_1367395 [Hydnum rufescens UP504]|uniref:Uncharacterized protein n=1 Tax=Hydnum rufescens UP504 TaxID=1448309 RepID=A0A9P6AIF0_9AGAM|nr:hypothetical protein BS47DRAFT_1367395 [Hydnum rufescens UP504]
MSTQVSDPATTTGLIAWTDTTDEEVELDDTVREIEYSPQSRDLWAKGSKLGASPLFGHTGKEYHGAQLGVTVDKTLGLGHPCNPYGAGSTSLQRKPPELHLNLWSPNVPTSMTAFGTMSQAAFCRILHLWSHNRQPPSLPSPLASTVTPTLINISSKMLVIWSSAEQQPLLHTLEYSTHGQYCKVIPSWLKGLGGCVSGVRSPLSHGTTSFS